MFSLLLVHACSGLQLALHAPARPAATVARATPPAMFEIDSNVLIGVGTLLASVGGGIGLIAFTENAGKANEERDNEQPCFECKGVKVVTCTICGGSGGALANHAHNACSRLARLGLSVAVARVLFVQRTRWRST
jgi:hypothetical protein